MAAGRSLNARRGEGEGFHSPAAAISAIPASKIAVHSQAPPLAAGAALVTLLCSGYLLDQTGWQKTSRFSVVDMADEAAGETISKAKRRLQRHIAKIKIGLAFYQIVCEYSNVFAIEYPSDIRALLRHLSFVNLDMYSAGVLSCLVDWSAEL